MHCRRRERVFRHCRRDVCEIGRRSCSNLRLAEKHRHDGLGSSDKRAFVPRSVRARVFSWAVALMNWARHERDIHHLIASVAPHNEASLAIRPSSRRGSQLTGNVRAASCRPLPGSRRHCRTCANPAAPLDDCQPSAGTSSTTRASCQPRRPHSAPIAAAPSRLAPLAAPGRRRAYRLNKQPAAQDLDMQIRGGTPRALLQQTIRWAEAV